MNEKKWYQKISNWIFILLVIILIPILAVNLYIMVQANSDSDKVPNVFGYKPFIVLSGSMETDIHVGDLIITKMCDPSKLKEDDVIAFRDDQNTVTTHRIIELVEEDGKTYFVTKGDNNNSQDQSLVSFENVEGIYIGRIPSIGNMLNELAKPTTIAIVLLGITIIFVLLFQISNKKLKSQEEKEFLEYKKMKEQEKKSSSKNKSKKDEKESTKNSGRKPTEEKTVKNNTSSKSGSKAKSTKVDEKKATTKKSTTSKKKDDKKSSTKKDVKKETPKKSTTKKTGTKSTKTSKK